MNRWASWCRRALVGASVTWAAALPLATYTASRPQIGAGPYVFALAVYMVGGAVCHQRDERSFHLWAHQMPVCARCAGIYAGAAVGALIAAARLMRSSRPRAPQRRWRTLLVSAAVPAAATLVFEWTTGIMPGNALRAATGVVLGAAVAWLVVYEVN